MNLILRLVLVLFRARYRSKLQLFQTSSLGRRVWPNDLDLQLHVNNGRFLSLMDLGRLDLLVRTGFWRETRRRGWYPLVGGVLIDYRRPLKVFERYELRTKLLGWQGRWFFFEQRFVKDGKVVAKATVKGMIGGPKGAVTPCDALGAIGFSGPSPELSGSARAMSGKHRDIRS